MLSVNENNEKRLTFVTDNRISKQLNMIHTQKKDTACFQFKENEFKKKTVNFIYHCHLRHESQNTWNCH